MLVLIILAITGIIYKWQYIKGYLFNRITAVVNDQINVETAKKTGSDNNNQNGNNSGSTSPATGQAYVSGNTAAPNVLGSSTSTSKTIITTQPEGKPDQAPIAKIIYPKDDNEVGSDTKVAITVYISDDVKVSKIQYYVNDKLLCESTNRDFMARCYWKVPGKDNVEYDIKVKATDTTGKTTTDKITVKSSDD